MYCAESGGGFQLSRRSGDKSLDSISIHPKHLTEKNLVHKFKYSLLLVSYSSYAFNYILPYGVCVCARRISYEPYIWWVSFLNAGVDIRVFTKIQYDWGMSWLEAMELRPSLSIKFFGSAKHVSHIFYSFSNKLLVYFLSMCKCQ